MVTWVYVLVKTHQNAPLKQVHPMEYKLHLKMLLFLFVFYRKKRRQVRCSGFLPFMSSCTCLRHHHTGELNDEHRGKEGKFCNFLWVCISKSKVEKSVVAEIGGRFSNACSINIEHLRLPAPETPSETDHTSAPWSLWSIEESRWRKRMETSR